MIFLCFEMHSNHTYRHCLSSTSPAWSHVSDHRAIFTDVDFWSCREIIVDGHVLTYTNITCPITYRSGLSIQEQITNSSFRLFSDASRDPNRTNYEAPFTCFKCGKQYTWVDSLTRHLRESCGITPKFRCSICSRRFRRRNYLLRHESAVHGITYIQWEHVILSRPSKWFWSLWDLLMRKVSFHTLGLHLIDKITSSRYISVSFRKQIFLLW